MKQYDYGSDNKPNTVSGLIKILEKIKSEHGDLEIEVQSDDGSWNSLSLVSVERDICFNSDYMLVKFY